MKLKKKITTQALHFQGYENNADIFFWPGLVKVKNHKNVFLKYSDQLFF